MTPSVTPSVKPSGVKAGIPEYALFNRPPMIGGLPKNITYTVLPKDSQSVSDRLFARHGLLQPSRKLTEAEVKNFELYEKVTEDSAVATPLISHIVWDMIEHATVYSEQYETHRAVFTRRCDDLAKKYGHGRYYFSPDTEWLIDAVKADLDDIVSVQRKRSDN